MKSKLTDEIKEIFSQSMNWAKLEIEYAKLTLAEKITVLGAMTVIGAICLLLGIVVLILLSLALAEALKLIMAPAYAYLATAGVNCVFLAVIWLCRGPLLYTPISKAITKVFFKSKH